MDTNVQVLNQVFEIQQKIAGTPQEASCERNFARIYSVMEEQGYRLQDPAGEAYSESRTDYEATIIGEPGKSMTVAKVIKPVIYLQENGSMKLLQKAIVLIEKKQ